jgi:hypothetical protein
MSNPWDEFIDGLGAPQQDIIGHFDSLGENCEFGFVLVANRAASSSLLTWGLVERPSAIVRLLEEQCANIFARENLQILPDAGLMLDTHFRIAFHSKLVEPERAAEYDAIYAEDFSKLAYLADKMLAQLREGKKIWVYKSQKPINFAQILALHGALAAYGPNRLLVIEADPTRPASVEMLDQGLFLGHLPAYAPGHEAWRFDPAGWNTILRTTLNMAGPLR